MMLKIIIITIILHRYRLTGIQGGLPRLAAKQVYDDWLELNASCTRVYKLHSLAY